MRTIDALGSSCQPAQDSGPHRSIDTVKEENGPKIQERKWTKNPRKKMDQKSVENEDDRRLGLVLSSSAGFRPKEENGPNIPGQPAVYTLVYRLHTRTWNRPARQLRA